MLSRLTVVVILVRCLTFKKLSLAKDCGSNAPYLPTPPTKDLHKGALQSISAVKLRG